MRGTNGDAPDGRQAPVASSATRRVAMPERGWDWEGILVDGRLHCFGYRGEAVLIPAPLPVYAA